MKIELLKGWHLTATERKAISKMIKDGMVKASNSPQTKIYEILKGYQDRGFWFYTVRILSKQNGIINQQNVEVKVQKF